MKEPRHLWLIIIIVLALVLRFWKLSSIPMGFMDDEASIGYNAYSILKTGKDEWGRLMPITNFKGFGEYKLPLTIYLTALSELFFGLNVLAVRFPSALFGVLTVGATFLLTRRMFCEKTAIIAMFLLAISPWHIFLNRFAHEANIALGLTGFGFYFLLKSKEKPRFLPIGLLLFILALYTYHAFQVFLPLFGLIFCWWKRRWFSRLDRKTKIFSLMVLVLSLPLLVAFFSHGQTRFQQVGIFSISNLPSGFQKPWFLVKVFFKNYLQNFSLYSLFTPVRFDQKHVIPMGLLYLFELPLILVGYFNLLKKKNQSIPFLTIWLWLYPFPNSLTQFGAIARMIVWLPLPQILAAVGVTVIWQRIKSLKRLTVRFSLGFLAVLIILFSFTRFVFDYFLYYPVPYALFSQSGRRATVEYLNTIENQYPAVLINVLAVNHIQLAFFSKTDPDLFRRSRDSFYDRLGECLPVFAKINHWYVVPGFPKECLRGDELLIFPAESFPEELVPLAVINHPNGDSFAKSVKAVDYLKFAEGSR